MAGKVNCWEAKKCGREPGGKNANHLGVCPAATSEKLNGIHHGSHGGRACWVVSGTLCGGAVQGTFAKKFNNCEACEFYQSVKSQEGAEFRLAATLLAITRS